MKTFDDSWRAWLAENLERKCNARELVDILRKNDFDLAAIAREMGEMFPPQISPADPALLCSIRITRPESGARHVESDKVQMYVLEDFMSAEECERLVELTRSGLRPSTITIPTPDAYFRTSTSSDLVHLADPFVDLIDARIAETIGIARELGESIQAQRYEVGQQFKEHTDYFQPDSDEYERYARPRGNRTWTFMVYLTDVEAGGGTQFVALGETFVPKRGRAVVWNNLYRDGRVNPDTLHAGLPVAAGAKVIITKWFRELPE